MDPKSILSASFLDILFEGKNKAYGAYELRSKYSKRLTWALITTVAVCLLIIGLYGAMSIINKNRKVDEAPIAKNVVLQNVDVKQPNQPPPPPPPPAPKPPEVKPQQQFTPPKVVKDNQVKPEDQPPDISQLKNKVISTKTLAGNPNGLDPGLMQDKGSGVVSAPKEETHVFTFVEQMPSFPGGEDALLKYLSSHINYPAVARENGIQGKVIVQFIVGPDGSISGVTTVGSHLGGGLEEEAMRVVRTMPKWRPGKQNGRAVTVQYDLPVNFVLQ